MITVQKRIPSNLIERQTELFERSDLTQAMQMFGRVIMSTSGPQRWFEQALGNIIPNHPTTGSGQFDELPDSVALIHIITVL